MFTVSRQQHLLFHNKERRIGSGEVGKTDGIQLAQALREKDVDCRILTLPFEPVTGAHAGPGALALFYFGDTEKRN